MLVAVGVVSETLVELEEEFKDNFLGVGGIESILEYFGELVLRVPDEVD